VTPAARVPVPAESRGAAADLTLGLTGVASFSQRTTTHNLHLYESECESV